MLSCCWSNGRISTAAIQVKVAKTRMKMSVFACCFLLLFLYTSSVFALNMSSLVTPVERLSTSQLSGRSICSLLSSSIPMNPQLKDLQPLFCFSWFHRLPFSFFQLLPHFPHHLCCPTLMNQIKKNTPTSEKELMDYSRCAHTHTHARTFASQPVESWVNECFLFLQLPCPCCQGEIWSTLLKKRQTFKTEKNKVWRSMIMKKIQKKFWKS